MEFMNKHTQGSLDIEYIFGMISPKTPYGMQIKSDIKPYRIGEEANLQEDLDELERLLNSMKAYNKDYKQIVFLLNDIKEIRGSLKRAVDGFVLDEVEFFEIKNFMMYVKDIVNIQNEILTTPESLKLERNTHIEKLLDPDNQGLRTFYVYDSYSQKLKEIRAEKKKLQREYDKGRKNLISAVEGALSTKLKFSGEISILKKDTEKIKSARECPYLTESMSTVLMVTYKLQNSEELDALEKQIQDIKDLEYAEEYGIRKNLSQEIKENMDSITSIINRVGRLDYYIAKAEFACNIGGVKPILHNENSISVKNGRHIKLQKVLDNKGKKFMPVTFTVSKGVTVITGANMGGKTINLKIAGMLTAMTQFGLYVPADEFKTYLFDYIYFSIGDMQSIDSGLSTFGSEIAGMIDILSCSAYRGLILIDELARGTNPEEGYAISRSIVRYLKGRDAITMFTTHFDGITREEGINHLQVIGLKGVNFDDLLEKLQGDKGGIDMVLDHMDYRLEKIEESYEVPKDALNIARLMGLDEEILDWAQKLLKS